MPAACRLNDLCSGHSCWPPRVNDQASDDVIINGLGAHRRTDHWIIHTCIDQSHDSVLEDGSPTFFTNGLEQGRIGDPVACGSVVATGSPDVDIGQ